MQEQSTFEEVLKHAESDEIRKRVEKASIACHALLALALPHPPPEATTYLALLTAVFTIPG